MIGLLVYAPLLLGNLELYSSVISDMSSLIPKTRVSWSLVVVKVDDVKSLNLIKKSYRGQLSYFSNSARGVTDKIGFGQVGSDPHFIF